MKHLADLDEISLKLTCGVNMIDAVHTAMVEGSCEPSGYVDALYGAFDYIRECTTKLQNYVDDEFSQRRKEGTV